MQFMVSRVEKARTYLEALERSLETCRVPQLRERIELRLDKVRLELNRALKAEARKVRLEESTVRWYFESRQAVEKAEARLARLQGTLNKAEAKLKEVFHDAAVEDVRNTLDSDNPGPALESETLG